jgi:hypothetical protein
MEKELIIMEAQELGVNRKNWEVLQCLFDK